MYSVRSETEKKMNGSGETMTSKVKSRKKVIRFTPENEDKIQRLADLNGVTFTAMVNMLLAQSLKNPKLVTE